MTKQYSAASLLASGAATITLHHRPRLPSVKSVREALETDRKALARDGRRVTSELLGQLERA